MKSCVSPFESKLVEYSYLYVLLWRKIGKYAICNVSLEKIKKLPLDEVGSFFARSIPDENRLRQQYRWLRSERQRLWEERWYVFLEIHK
ncbi:hypothetical protein AB685_05765 [Bacillus sp. LL01]|nr:hypothetical protein AB685_05765 [Bacillus sp. LL01]